MIDVRDIKLSEVAAKLKAMYGEKGLTMKRDEWTFQFSTDKLLEGATAKIRFHQGRVDFWQEAKEKAITEAKASGITISESDADGGSNRYTSAMTPQVMIDQTYQRRIMEAHQKIAAHHGKVTEYEGWSQVFEANKGRSLDLTADDYLFFFGK